MTLDQIRRYYFRKPGQYPFPTHIFVYALYSIMEWFQYVQHLHGFASCDDTNTKLTLIAHILIWIQPIVLNLHSFYYCKDNERILFRFTMFCTCLTFCISSLSLYIGYMQSLTGSFPSTNEKLNNIGPQLCTIEEGIHFSWYFPYDSLQGYRPMGYIWLLLAVGPHLFRGDTKIDPNDWLGQGPLYGLVILSGWLVTWSIIGLGSQNWSLWCVHSVTYLITPYVIWDVLVPLGIVPEKWIGSNTRNGK